MIIFTAIQKRKNKLFYVSVLFYMLYSLEVLAVEERPADAFGSLMCDIVRIFSKWWARAIAIIAIIALGIKTLNGKLRWEVALIIITGIIILFSADKIVSTITGKPNVCYDCKQSIYCPAGK